MIVDEVHAVAGTKRGAHLSISLERLEELTRVAPQRLGLSATQRPLETIARFLGGGTVDEGGDWVPRPVRVVDVPGDHDLEVELVVPVEDMTAPLRPEPAVSTAPDGIVDPPDPRLPASRPSVWEAIYPEGPRADPQPPIDHRLRQQPAARRADLLRARTPSPARSWPGPTTARYPASRGSPIEEGLKRGELRAVVATSSLELGIDMGAVDLVIQVESPTSVASGLQRVGRAGHQVGAVSRAKVFPKFRGDLLEATVVVDRMVARAVESTRIPRNPLDVLAQHVVSMVSVEPWNAADLLAVVRRRAPYSDLAAGPVRGDARHAGGPLPLGPLRRVEGAYHLGPRRGPSPLARGLDSSL